jgi:hypothetical protein
MAEPLTDQVRQRARGGCEYCHLPESHLQVAFEIEHIIPRQHRGKTVLGNLAYACIHCNRHKGTNLAGFDHQTSSTRLVQLFHPRRHKWDRHFRIEGTYIIGRTPIGRVTVEVLNMNDPLWVAIREELIADGLFPPPL